MRRTNGFTLIEFLIALAIIGFVVALLANFFADPPDEAQIRADTSAIIEAMRTMQDGYNRYKSKTGCAKDPFTGCVADMEVGGLTSQGVLTALPQLPTRILVDGGPYMAASDSLLASRGLGWGFFNHADAWGADHTVVVLIPASAAGRGVTSAICRAFNERMGHGATIIDPSPKWIKPTKGAQCVADPAAVIGTADDNYIIWPLYSY